jgi:hypothetical protein
MTRIFERTPPAGPVARAFVIGVGAYPSAKPASADAMTPVQLRNVPDLQSAATGAALFTDWLIVNADIVAAPLASIDLLLNLSVEGQAVSAYEWTSRIPIPCGATDPRGGVATVHAPTTANVKEAGTAWKNDLTSGADNLAIFFICGHGAILGNDNLVFLADLNGDTANPWGALLNIQTHASAFKVMPSIKTAFFFVDACSELVTDIVLQNPGVGAQFATSAGKLGIEKVTLLSAAVPKRLAYEGSVAGRPQLKTGRFTQCLLQGLQGAAVRPLSDGAQWTVHGTSLFESLKPLYALRTDWNDLSFDPNPPMLPADRFKIISFAQPPTVPLRIRFEPPRINAWSLELHDHIAAPVDGRPTGPAVDWLTGAPASLFPYTLTAASDTENKSMYVTTYQSEYCYAL